MTNQMSSHQPKHVVALAILTLTFFVSFALVIFAAKSIPRAETPMEPLRHINKAAAVRPSAPEPVASAPAVADPYANGSYNVVVSEASVSTGAKTMANTYCNFTYTLPAGWVAGGIVGGTNLFSPEDQKENASYEQAHPNLDGDTPLVSSLYLSCEHGVREYLDALAREGSYYDSAAAKSSLTDAFATQAFNGPGGELKLVGLLEIGGQAAYQLARSDESMDGTHMTHYSIITARDRVLVIDLRDTEYRRLPDATRKIVDSLRFTPTTGAEVTAVAGERIINFQASKLPQVSFEPCLYCDDTARDYTEAERAWLTKELVAPYAASLANNGLVVMWVEFSVAQRDGRGSFRAVLFKEKTREFMTDGVDITPTADGKFEMVPGAGPEYRG